ncbi:hypothetical protein I545_1913 [Mycobacterium kansasii 662]|uniref:Uncharacterized protein n=2 Tax=Mycobacterium kansasii TaxID=1768 RepID=A0A1V3XQB0_MYCKA|nr:hypothetical protein I545_1913 [Mycobacterium kansasii 662]KEP39914.1 hypothetical protein MKSMC1_49620 [Mycobacterium kansasii]OOK80691.1 hypothetical protein BZL29_2407 [Mycobacterium kansasii]
MLVAQPARTADHAGLSVTGFALDNNDIRHRCPSSTVDHIDTA